MSKASQGHNINPHPINQYIKMSANCKLKQQKVNVQMLSPKDRDRCSDLNTEYSSKQKKTKQLKVMYAI